MPALEQAARPGILVVEDERIVARDLQQALNHMGYDAFAVASSGAEALACAAQRKPDLVLIDIRIAGPVDGISTAQTLREQHEAPIVFLTAYTDDETLDRAKRAEPHGYLVKPVRQEDLRSAVEVALFKARMERAMRERERWFSTTLRSIADAVVTVDLERRISFVNASAEALLGLTSANYGQVLGEIVQFYNSQGEPVAHTPLCRAINERRINGPDEMRVRHLQTSQLHPVSSSAAPVSDGARALGAVMILRDLSSELRARQQLELGGRLVALGTLAAGIAHEINNPLAVVLMGAEYLERLLTRWRDDANANPDNRLGACIDAAHDLQVGATRIARIVSDLRTFGQQAPETPGAVDLSEVVRWAMRVTAHLLAGRARVVVELAEISRVKGDETRLGQVLVNLLVNAAHAIPLGRPDHHQVAIRARETQGGVLLEITDTGVGMAPGVASRVFDPFYTTKPVGAGTGLGLSICHGIVLSLGGTIELDSEVGRGTTVRVLLPLAATTTLAAKTGAAATAQPTRRGQVMVIDDDELVRVALNRVLGEQHDVVCVSSGQEALEILAREGARFDVILCDVMMPGMKGDEVYAKLKVTDPGSAQRVVFLTGGALIGQVQEFLAAVARPCVEKPFEAQALLDLVGERVRLRAEGK